MTSSVFSQLELIDATRSPFHEQPLIDVIDRQEPDETITRRPPSPPPLQTISTLILAECGET